MNRVRKRSGQMQLDAMHVLDDADDILACIALPCFCLCSGSGTVPLGMTFTDESIAEDTSWKSKELRYLRMEKSNELDFFAITLTKLD